MFESRSEIFGWVLAVLVVVAMGIIVFAGPFHKVNKPQPAAAAAGPVQHVKIVTDPKTIGRYKPAAVTIKVGQEIDFTNDSNAIHTVTANDNSFNSADIGTGGKTWVFTGKVAGTFKYYCIYHPLMKGTITVRS